MIHSSKVLWRTWPDVSSRFILTIILLAGIALGPTAPLRGDSVMLDKYGINTQMLWYSDTMEIVDEIIASGIKWVRITPGWETIETAQDTYNWTYVNKVDDVIEELTAHGVNIVWTLGFTPAWASSAPGGTGYPANSRYRPTNWSDWEDFVTWVTDRYDGKVFYWEVWNEQDSQNFWKSSVADYRTLLEKASVKIRASNASNVVLIGGMTGTGYTFLSNLVNSSSVADTFDVINYHTYADSPGMVSTYKQFMGVANSKGFADKPVWVTELGYTTSGDSSLERSKAEHLEQAYVTHFSMPDVERIFLYVYRNTTTSNSFEDNFGLETHAQSPLPAFSHFQAADGAESDFATQDAYPAEAGDRLTLTYVDAASGDGVVQDHATLSGVKVIPVGGYMYYRVNDNWIYDGNNGLDDAVILEVTYWDDGSAPWILQYQSQSSNTQAIMGYRTNTQAWKTESFQLDDIKFANGQNYSADFRLFAGGSLPLNVARVTMRRDMETAAVVLKTNNLGRLLEHVLDTNSSSNAYNAVTTIGGRECRMIPDKSKYFYFKVCDGLIRPTLTTQVAVRLHYYDQGTDNLTIQYVSTTSGGAYVNATPLTKTNTGQWLTHTFLLDDAKFDNSKSWGSDFRIYSGIDNSPEYIEKVEVWRTDGLAMRFPHDIPDDTTGPQRSDYELWAYQKFKVDVLDDPATSGMMADPDADGMPNLLEYAFGVEPLQADFPRVFPARDTDHLGIRFERYSLLSDLVYSVYVSHSLEPDNWSLIAQSIGGYPTTAVGDEAHTIDEIGQNPVSVTVAGPIASLSTGTPSFYRLDVDVIP